MCYPLYFVLMNEGANASPLKSLSGFSLLNELKAVTNLGQSFVSISYTSLKCKIIRFYSIRKFLNF